MTIAEFQAWLNDRGADLLVDDKAGPVTRAAMYGLFANVSAPAVSDSEIAATALKLGCTAKQLRAVAKVESGGAAFDPAGRPKILFERHYFHRLTDGQWSVTAYSDPTAGGYNDDSWLKLSMAASKDPWAAFQSASWGKFQIMGAHWQSLGYASPLDMAWAMRQSEVAHYDALARFVKANGLLTAIRQLSTIAADNVAFASVYNGPGFRNFSYHTKLAGAMA